MLPHENINTLMNKYWPLQEFFGTQRGLFCVLNFNEQIFFENLKLFVMYIS